MSTCFCKHLKILTVALLAFQLSGCGTMFYSERRGQEKGKVDVGVALMDGFWIFMGIIPGIVAFAVDYSTGAIYVPEKSAGIEDGVRVVRFDPKTTSRDELEAIIERETGKQFSFDDQRLKITRLKNKEAAAATFAGL